MVGSAKEGMGMIASMIYVDEEHYDVKGDAYKRLIDYCFHYSAYFSFISPRDNLLYQTGKTKKLDEQLNDWKLKTIKTLQWPGNTICNRNISLTNSYSRPAEYHIYRCTNGAKEIIKSASPSLFSWEDGLPEDLAFYYEDKRVFMYSVTHEGDCVLSCSKKVFSLFAELNYWKIESESEYIQDIYF